MQDMKNFCPFDKYRLCNWQYIFGREYISLIQGNGNTVSSVW